MDDDFVESLLFEVKQEIVENFFAERLRLEELKALCQERVAEQRRRVLALGRSRGRLSRLLLDDEHRRRFCSLLGIDPGSFAPSGVPEGGRVLEGTPHGLTLAGRYGALLALAYEDLAAKAEACVEGQAELEAALRAYNEDVEQYARNFDVMTIVAVLNRMSPEEIERRHWLGENYRPEETASLADALTIRPLALPADLQAVSMALPHLRQVRPHLKALARDLCHHRTEEVRAQLARYLLPKRAGA